MTAGAPGTGPKKVTGAFAQEHRFPALWPGAVGILFLLFAVIPTLPSGYYTMLRYIVCALSAVMIVLAGYCHRWEWILPFLFLAAVFNPVRWPGFSLRYWQLADIAGALLFLLAAYFIYPKRKAPDLPLPSPTGTAGARQPDAGAG